MKKISILSFVALISLKIFLEYSYIDLVQPSYKYDGFFVEISFLKLIESYILYACISTFIIYSLEEKKYPSKIVVYILLIFLYTPLSSLFWLENQPRSFFYTITASILLIISIVVYLPKIKLPQLKFGSLLLAVIFGGITIIVYSMLITNGGLGRINFNLLEVYEVREAYANTTNRLLSYLLTWQAHVINMTLLALALYFKKNKIALLIISAQLLLFGMTNFKSFLFAPAILIFFHLFYKTKYKEKILFILSIGSFALILFVSILSKVSGNIIFASIFIRRLFFVPSQLHYVYFSFFEDIEKYYLSHSIFKRFIENQYGINPVGLLARDYYGKEFSPNVGFFGDAYLNFGLVGIIIFSIILGLLLKIIDSISDSIPLSLSMSILVIPSMALVNSALFTSLLTHGILLVVLTLWLLNPVFTQINSDKSQSKMANLQCSKFKWKIKNDRM